MTKRIGLVVCLAAVFTLAGLCRPLFSGPTDDTPTKDGIEAEAAFKKLKTLVGSWTGKTSHDEKKEEAKKDHEDAMPEEVSVTYQADGCRKCPGRDAVSRNAARDGFRLPSRSQGTADDALLRGGQPAAHET